MPHGLEYVETINLTTIECGSCGITFGAPDRWIQARRDDHKTFYCPNGCPRAYQGESKAERAERHRQEAERALHRRTEQLEAERRSHAATKGQLTKTRKRVAGGVCPCCNRTFQNLGRHMHTKHPGFAETA